MMFLLINEGSRDSFAAQVLIGAVGVTG